MNPDRIIVEVTEDDMGEQMMDPLMDVELEEIRRRLEWAERRRMWRMNER